MADAESLNVEERTHEIAAKGIKVLFETDSKLKYTRASQLMASNFQITYNRLEGSIHLKLYGDFDGSSAHELLNLIKDKSKDKLRIYIHTDGLKHTHPFGLNTFLKGFRIIKGCTDRVVFTGKKAHDLSLP